MGCTLKIDSKWQMVQYLSWLTANGCHCQTSQRSSFQQLPPFLQDRPRCLERGCAYHCRPHLLLSFVAQKNQTCQATMQKHAKTKKHYNRKLIPPFIDGATALPETRPHVVLECLGTVFAALWTTLGTFNPCASHLIQWKGQGIVKGSLAQKLPIYERHLSKVKSIRVVSSRVESSRVESSRVESSRVESSRVK